MTMTMLAWLIALPLLGVLTGCRTLTPIAVLCWFAYKGNLPVDGTWASWTGHLVTAIIFTVLAAGELVVDKLPGTGSRTALAPLLARLVFGGLVGAIVATGLDGDLVEGIVLGMSGALLGAFGGYLVRRRLVHRAGWEDWHVAVLEDVITVCGSILAMGVVTG